MNKTTNKADRFNAKDLINIGIFAAIYLVVYTTVGIIVGLTVIGALASNAIASLFTGVIYMLIACKIRKRGAYFITGMAMALLIVTSGNIYGIIGAVIAALVSELIANRNRYRKISDLILAYMAVTTINFISYCLPMYSATQEYMAQAVERWHLNQQAIDAYTKYLNWTTFGVLIVLNIATSFVGAWIGVKILNKHFRKAGLIQ